jgi:hypothetical protein
MHRTLPLLAATLVACSPIVDDRDITPATPTPLVGEIHIDEVEGASRLAVSRLRYAWAVAPGDLDGDGLDDLVVLERQSEGDQRGFLHVFLFAREGLPRDLRPSDAELSFELGEGFEPYDRPRKIGDLDGDGRAEIAFEHGPYAEEHDLAVVRWEDMHEGIFDFDDAGARLVTRTVGDHARVWAPETSTEMDTTICGPT